MKSYPSIATAFSTTPWAILPAKLEEIRAFLQRKVDGRDGPPDDVIAEYAAANSSRRQGVADMVGRTAVVPVFGTISQRVGMLERSSGGVSTESLGAHLEELAADRGVSSIVLCVDSPGGSVFGVEQLAATIRELSAKKKIVGLADSMAASAAYWLMSSCAECHVAPGGTVGSIGVLAAHVDTSEADKREGVKTTYVTSAKFKVEGAPELPLSDEARAEMQSKVDHYHAQFTRDVAKGRRLPVETVRAGFGEGRMVTAKDAVGRGMADSVTTLKNLLGRLSSGTPSASGAAASAAASSARADAAYLDRTLMAMALAEMAEDDAIPPAWSSSSRVAGVDPVGRVVYGCEVARVGRHRGEELWLDRASLDGIAGLMRADAKGVRCRLSHPKGPQEVDPVERYLGRFRSARVAGDRVLADLHLDPSSALSPSGNLVRYVLERAASDPASFSASLVMRFRHETLGGRDAVRPVSIFACDIVDSGAFTGALVGTR